MGGSTNVADHAEDGHGHGGDGHDHAEDGHEHRSRWPLVAAVGAGALYFGIGLWFVGGDLVPLVLPVALAGVGVPLFLIGIAGWLNQAFLSAHWRGAESDRAEIYTGGMVLFLLSDVATFSAGFIYYAFIRAGTWPPSELPHLLGSLVVVNTAILLVSSATLHYGHAALEAGNRRRFLGLLGTTLVLGIVFLAGQALEYYEFIVGEGFSISSGVFASAFYGLTGLHGLHVALGVVLLGIVTGRALRGHYSPERDTSVRTVSLYWHFVDVVWVFLVLVVYVAS